MLPFWVTEALYYYEDRIERVLIDSIYILNTYFYIRFIIIIIKGNSHKHTPPFLWHVTYLTAHLIVFLTLVNTILDDLFDLSFFSTYDIIILILIWALNMFIFSAFGIFLYFPEDEEDDEYDTDAEDDEYDTDGTDDEYDTDSEDDED